MEFRRVLFRSVVVPPDGGTVHSEVRVMVQRAVDRGLDREVADDLCVQLLQLDLWRMELGADPPAKAPPFLVSLKPGAKPFRAGTRRQSDVQRASLKAEIERMVELGLMYFKDRKSTRLNSSH